MYKCKYFKIQELVNPELLKMIPENTIWMMFDDRLLKCADLVREKYGVITINAGTWIDCGLRKMDSKNGAKWSAHKFARALDLHIVSLDKKYAGKKEEKIKAYDEVRKLLLKDEAFSAINFEMGISWLHIDTFNRQSRIFNP